MLGLLLLGWLFSYMRRPDWDEVQVEVLVTVYFLAADVAARSRCLVRSQVQQGAQAPLPEAKRKAILQRRGLFDFVSPFVVFLAVLSYFLFAAFVIYSTSISTTTRPFPACWPHAIGVRHAGLRIECIRRVQVRCMAEKNPFVTHEGRVHTIGVTVKSGVYGSIAVAWFISVFGTLGQPGLQEWRPFALTVFLVISTFLCFISLTAPRKPEGNGLGSSSKVPS